MATIFETQSCTRCGGSGKYSWCPMYLDMCFKCSGAGQCYTKRGAVAKEYFENLLSIEAKDLKVGQQYWCTSYAKNGWRTVVSVSIGPGCSGTTGPNGEFVPHTMVLVETQKTNRQFFLDRKVRVRPTSEFLEECKAKALAYQESLTKLGKERKKKCTAP